MSAPSPHVDPTSARVIVVWLFAAHLAFAPFALTHLDFARDVVRGLEIAGGQAFPLQGPVLAGAIHLGPVWYYLLAAVLAVSRSWLAVCVVVALIEAAKFALAYHLGRTLWNPATGVLWAAGLALPAWTLYAQVLPTHPSLVETLVLAFLLFTARFHQSGTTLSLASAAVMYALALHAHPTTLPIVLLALPPIVIRLRRRTLSWGALALACVAALAWFVPALYQQLAVGFADLRSSQQYFASDYMLGSPADALRLVSGWFVTGPRVVASDLLGWSDASGIGMAALLVAWVVVGVVAAFLNFRRIRHGGIVAYAAMVVIATVVVVASIRFITPYYFAFSMWPIVTGIAAVGLSTLFASKAARIAPLALAVIVLGLSTAVQARAASQIAGGRVRLALLPLFDIKAPFVHGTRTPLMPAYAMARAGERYCASRGATLHGALAFMALHDYGVEALLSCGVRPELTLGGPRTGDQPDLLGLSRPMAMQLGVSVPTWLGPIAVVNVERSIHPERGYALPRDHPYPPVAGAYGPATTLTLNISATADELIVVSDDYFAFTMPPAFHATVAGRAVAPVAADAISTAFACAACAGPAQEWQLSIVTPDPRRVDVVVLRRHSAP